MYVHLFYLNIESSYYAVMDYLKKGRDLRSSGILRSVGW